MMQTMSFFDDYEMQFWCTKCSRVQPQAEYHQKTDQYLQSLMSKTRPFQHYTNVPVDTYSAEDWIRFYHNQQSLKTCGPAHFSYLSRTVELSDLFCLFPNIVGVLDLDQKSGPIITVSPNPNETSIRIALHRRQKSHDLSPDNCFVMYLDEGQGWKSFDNNCAKSLNYQKSNEKRPSTSQKYRQMDNSNGVMPQIHSEYLTATFHNLLRNENLSQKQSNRRIFRIHLKLDGQFPDAAVISPPFCLIRQSSQYRDTLYSFVNHILNLSCLGDVLVMTAMMYKKFPLPQTEGGDPTKRSIPNKSAASHRYLGTPGAMYLNRDQLIDIAQYFDPSITSWDDLRQQFDMPIGPEFNEQLMNEESPRFTRWHFLFCVRTSIRLFAYEMFQSGMVILKPAAHHPRLAKMALLQAQRLQPRARCVLLCRFRYRFYRDSDQSTAPPAAPSIDIYYVVQRRDSRFEMLRERFDPRDKITPGGASGPSSKTTVSTASGSLNQSGISSGSSHPLSPSLSNSAGHHSNHPSEVNDQASSNLKLFLTQLRIRYNNETIDPGHCFVLHYETEKQNENENETWKVRSLETLSQLRSNESDSPQLGGYRAFVVEDPSLRANLLGEPCQLGDLDLNTIISGDDHDMGNFSAPPSVSAVSPYDFAGFQSSPRSNCPVSPYAPSDISDINRSSSMVSSQMQMWSPSATNVPGIAVACTAGGPSAPKSMAPSFPGPHMYPSDHHQQQLFVSCANAPPPMSVVHQQHPHNGPPRVPIPFGPQFDSYPRGNGEIPLTSPADSFIMQQHPNVTSAHFVARPPYQQYP